MVQRRHKHISRNVCDTSTRERGHAKLCGVVRNVSVFSLLLAFITALLSVDECNNDDDINKAGPNRRIHLHRSGPGSISVAGSMGPIVRVCMCKHVHPKYTNTPQENGIKTPLKSSKLLPNCLLADILLVFFCSLSAFHSISLALRSRRSRRQVQSRNGRAAPLGSSFARSANSRVRAPWVRSQSAAIMLLCSPKTCDDDATDLAEQIVQFLSTCTVLWDLVLRMGWGNSEGTWCRDTTGITSGAHTSRHLPWRLICMTVWRNYQIGVWIEQEACVWKIRNRNNFIKKRQILKFQHSRFTLYYFFAVHYRSDSSQILARLDENSIFEACWPFLLLMSTSYAFKRFFPLIVS